MAIRTKSKERNSIENWKELAVGQIHVELRLKWCRISRNSINTMCFAHMPFNIQTSLKDAFGLLRELCKKLRELR